MGQRERKLPGENKGPDDEERPQALFELGQIVGTLGALAALREAKQDPVELIVRHVTGDWEELPEEDQEENRSAVEKGFRVFSSYRLSSGRKVWVITEGDRSTTTLLLPEDY